MTQPSPVKARLVAEGGWDKAFAVINLDSDLDLTIPPMRVPTCQLQHGFGPDSVDIVPYPRANVDLQSDAEAFYGRHGVQILATMVPREITGDPERMGVKPPSVLDHPRPRPTETVRCRAYLRPPLVLS